MTSLQTTVKNNSKYTEDWLPIRNISNGMIILNNKKKPKLYNSNHNMGFWHFFNVDQNESGKINTEALTILKLSEFKVFFILLYFLIFFS